MCWPSTGAGTDQNIASTVSFDQQVSRISDGIGIIKDIKVRKILFAHLIFFRDVKHRRREKAKYIFIGI